MTDNNSIPSEQIDIYSQITQKIVADLDKGEMTWRKPWSMAEHAKVLRPLRFNGVPYSGINTVLLWSAATEGGYQSPYWMTFRQAAELNAKVREGEKGTYVVFADKITKEEAKENGESQKQLISLLKTYSVFNANQIEGLPEKYYTAAVEKLSTRARIKKIDQFMSNTGAEIITGDKAVYYPGSDKIEMPPFDSFVNAVRYYGTLSHEVTHWTKHPSRLNRDFNNKRFSDEGYAMEELVAELGACFIAADLGFEPIIKDEHTAYIKSWLKVMQHDKRFIFMAA